jgi:hypothetical protein
MKTKLLAVMATLGMVASASAVKINNNLSINGFIDGSYLNTDSTASAAAGGAQSESTNTGIDEVELNFLVNAGNVSGELHIDTEDADNDVNLDIEQVHFTYSFQNGASIQVGRFGSNLGLEREDPAGLYTYSRAYNTINYDLGNIDAGNVGEGIRLAYATGDFSLSLGLTNPVGAVEEGNIGVGGAAGENDYDYEFVISYTGFDNLSLTAGVISTAEIDTKPANAADENDVDVYSINASYTLDKLLIAGEYTSREEDGSDDLSAYLLLLDYDINEKLGVALRYSEWETAANAESDKITFAPNYAITESLGAIVEFSAEEASSGAEEDTIAVELTYTF